MSQGLVHQPRGSSASGDISATQVWCSCLSTRQNNTGLVRGLWPPERLGCDLQPLLLHRSGGVQIKHYSGGGADFCSVSAASTTAGKSLDGTVSPAMLSSPKKWLSLPPAAPAGHRCPFPAGQCTEGEGRPSPRQGAGSVWVMGSFLSQVKTLISPG